MFARRKSLFAAFVLAVAPLGCKKEAAEPQEVPLQGWKGNWQAVEVAFRSDAFDPVVDAIHELRPEYTTEEIKDFFVAIHDVDFTEVRVTSDSLTFLDGGAVVCAGRYAAHAGGHADGEMHGHDDSTTLFQLVAAHGGDCSAYATAEFGAAPEFQEGPDGPEAHFHLTAGPPRADPWRPAVALEMTPSRITETFLPVAPRFAEDLPPK